jgi:hypothetical protein
MNLHVVHTITYVSYDTEFNVLGSVEKIVSELRNGMTSRPEMTLDEVAMAR